MFCNRFTLPQALLLDPGGFYSHFSVKRSQLSDLSSQVPSRAELVIFISQVSPVAATGGHSGNEFKLSVKGDVERAVIDTYHSN